jgi:hypothetical protein
MMCDDQYTRQVLYVARESSSASIFGGYFQSGKRRDTAGMEPQSLTSIGRGILIMMISIQLTGSGI